MAYNTILIKRRLTGDAGGPASLSGGELAFNEVDDTLYYGHQDGVTAIGGHGYIATQIDALSATLQSTIDTEVAILEQSISSNVATLNTTIQTVSSTLDQRITDEVAALVDSAPDLLNTLNELASALGDDENFAVTISNNIAANSTKIDTVSAALTTADATLQSNIDSLESTVVSVSGDLQTQIDNLDSSNSSSVDALSAELKDDISAEEAARIAADSALTSTVQSVSSTLDSKIDYEVDALDSDVVALSAAIDAEESAREQAVSDLAGQIGSLTADVAQDIADGDAAVTSYVNSNFLPLSGGDLTGGLTVTGDVSASGTVYAAGGLEVAGGEAGDATFYAESGKVGINTEAPNHELTVSGSVSATGTVYAADATFSGNVTVAAPSADSHAATKKYVDDSVTNLVDSAPATLDTLNELAAALGDDANFATTIATNIGANTTLINTVSGDLAQEISDREQAIADLTSSVNGLTGDLDTKIDSLSSTVDANFVEKTESDAVTLNGGLTVSNGINGDSMTLTGTATVAEPTVASHAATKNYVDIAVAVLDGGTF